MYVRRKQPGFPQRTRERGVVLLVALIFLVLITMLALVASSGSLLQQRMVSATRSAQLATMSGDSALRGAEWRIWSSAAAAGSSLSCFAGAISTTTGCVKYDPTSPLYDPTGAVTQFQTADNAWLNGIGITYKGPANAGFTSFASGSGDVTANLAEDPQYIIEDMGLVKPPGAGPQHESGQTGPNNGGPGQVNLKIYRITARATGGDKNTVRVVQSTFDAQTN